MTQTILVTGGTGNNGKAVLEHLARSEASVRAMLRDPSKAAVTAPNISYVQGDFDDPESLARALSGADAAFLVTAYEPDFSEKHATFIQAAEAAGVGHVVQLSGVNADAKSPIQTLKWLGEAEDHLKSSLVPSTILRAASFTNNFFAFAHGIASDGVIAAPYGEDPTATLTLVDNRDIGAVAATILLDPQSHVGETYTLTGIDQLNHDQIARVFGKVLGRTVSYRPISDADAKQGLLDWQVPEVLADSLVQLWAAIREGVVRPPLTNDVARILGRQPLSFEQFVRDEAYQFNLQ